MNEVDHDKVLEFRASNQFDQNEEQSPIWMAKLGSFEMPLPNFKWRRAILAQHDMHHIISKYDTSPKAELLVAAWELGAARYEDWRAKMLCAFLMALGLLSHPRDTHRAFIAGRLYRQK